MTYRKIYGTKEKCNWVCPLGTHSECPGSENIICCVLAHLHCDHGGQSTHCPDCGVQYNPGCPYVLFLGYLSFMDAVTIVMPNIIMDLLYEKKTISFQACMTQLFIGHLFGGAELFTPGCHGLWPLCGHLQTLALFDHHESASVCYASSPGPGWWVFTCCSSTSLCLQPFFLWPQCNWPLHLWHVQLVETCLHWHLHYWPHSGCQWWGDLCGHLHALTHLLWSHPALPEES